MSTSFSLSGNLSLFLSLFVSVFVFPPPSLFLSASLFASLLLLLLLLPPCVIALFVFFLLCYADILLQFSHTARSHTTHVHSPQDTKPFEIELEFLGKDSMLYKQSIDFSKYGDLGKAVYKCLRTFCKKKTPEQEVFENLTPTILNKHLTTLMPGLSAKVFRTFNASITLEAELPSQEDLEGLSVAEKVVKYNAANRQVAILCNHQKTVSKSAEAQFESLAEKLNTLTRYVLCWWWWWWW